jgi:isoleucyl-tRNA synthetase
VLEELNVRVLELIPDESEMVERSLYPLLPVIGPRHGKAVGAVMSGARSGAWEQRADGTVAVGGVTLQPDEYELTARARPGHEVAEDGDLLVALDTTIDPSLAAEGIAREVAHGLQALRKSAGYEISDRIEVAIGAGDDIVGQLEPHRAWLAAEVLATELSLGDDGGLADADARETMTLDGGTIGLAIRRAGPGSVG